jgi:site-specific recombinase XerD
MFPSQFITPSASSPSDDHRSAAARPIPGVVPENSAAIAALDDRLRGFLRYVQTVKNQSPQSIAWYEKSYASYRRYLTTLLHLPSAEFAVKSRAIDAWVQWNRERGLSAISTNNYWRGLRAFFKDVEKRDSVLSPFTGISAPRFPKSEPKAKTADECRRIMETAEHYPWGSDYTRALAVATIGTMLYAGLRRSEIIRLRYGDVDLDAQTLLVHEGKGAYGGRDRRAYVSDELRSILSRYMRERTKRGYASPEFFTSSKTKQGITYESLRRLIDRVRGTSGVRFTAHTLRHSFVTHLLKSGVPLHVVSKLAGHRQISTTMGYAAIFERDLADGIEQLHF